MKTKKYNHYEGNKPLKPSVIPRQFLEEMCYSIGGLKLLSNCPYYVTSDCPNVCEYSNRLSKGISHTAKLGIERFYARYPDYANR